MILSIAIVGPGGVGSELIAQLSRFVSTRLKINVYAIANSKKMIMSPKLENYRQSLDQDGIPTDLASIADSLKDLPNPIIVDCTSSQLIPEMYAGWLKRGIHIVTPNKKAFSGPMQVWNDLFKLANEHCVCLLHESTVGAGLPVISTLKDLVNTGDDIISIEGIFSGTLSFLFNTFSDPSSKLDFSQVVTMAKNLGYTEPDPRDDLGGLDVARKVVILARIAGISLETCSLPIDNILPKELSNLESSQEFMDRLSEFNSHFKSLNDQALQKGHVLRFVGVVQAEGSGVYLRSYPNDHPFAQLKGSDNIIAFKTRRFPSPLIIQGSGAGAEVTAFGIFSDCVKICSVVKILKLMRKRSKPSIAQRLDTPSHPKTTQRKHSIKSSAKHGKPKTFKPTTADSILISIQNDEYQPIMQPYPSMPISVVEEPRTVPPTTFIRSNIEGSEVYTTKDYLSAVGVRHVMPAAVLNSDGSLSSRFSRLHQQASQGTLISSGRPMSAQSSRFGSLVDVPQIRKL